jgi:peptidoglycan/xylan/chitin deacetylase (PgdA/CDA1 family)
MLLAVVLGLLLLFLILYILYYPPILLFTILQALNPEVLFHLPLKPDQRILALTIDDSPSIYTARILDALRKHGAKATFFIIGDQVPGHEDILKRIRSEGHECGNHAWSDEKTILRPLNEIEQQIRAVERLLPSNGNRVKYFRPGGGFFTGKMVKKVTEMGWKVVLGCIFPWDPIVTSAWVNARHVVCMARPGGIIILHDRRAHSVRQVELMLEGLKTGREEGWKVLSLGGLLEFGGWEEK